MRTIWQRFYRECRRRGSDDDDPPLAQSDINRRRGAANTKPATTEVPVKQVVLFSPGSDILTFRNIKATSD